MADIRIERQHGMNFSEARKTAFKWAEQAEEKFDMACTYEEGQDSDEVHFKRSGVTGTLNVTANSFVLQAQLGFLLSAFKDKIEGEVVKNLDALILKNNPAAKKTACLKVTVKKPHTPEL